MKFFLEYINIFFQNTVTMTEFGCQKDHSLLQSCQKANLQKLMSLLA